METATPNLIKCHHSNCTATFCHVPARRFPNLCIDHADDADRATNGWSPNNSTN